MKNLKKDFESELYKAFRRAAVLELADEISPEEANRMFPPPCEFKELLSKYEEKQKEESTSSIAPKRNGVSRSLKLVAAMLVLVMMTLTLMGSRQVKSTQAHGYTINEYIDGYEYFKELVFPFHSYEEYYSFLEIGPIHRKYVPTYIPEVCPYTYYYYQPHTSYEASYSFYNIDEETGEYVNDVKVYIFASKTQTIGISNKVAKHPEIIELSNGDHGVIVRQKKTDMITHLFWANEEISISIVSDKLPFEELVKILEGIKYTTEFTN